MLQVDEGGEKSSVDDPKGKKKPKPTTLA